MSMFFKTTFVAAAGLALAVAVMPGSAMACDVTSSTDISCGSANSAFAQAHQEHPENDSHPPVATSSGSEADAGPFEFNPFGLFSDIGLCRLGDYACPAHDRPAGRHRRHRHSQAAQ